MGFMVKRIIIFFIILCAFILGSFNATFTIKKFPIDIEEKDKEFFAQARLFLDTNEAYKGENLWCANVIHEENKTTFIFYSGAQKETEDSRIFGLYNKIKNCPCFPIHISFMNDTMIVE